MTNQKIITKKHMKLLTAKKTEWDIKGTKRGWKIEETVALQNLKMN